MSNLTLNNMELFENINFTEGHIGGLNNDTTNSFKNQKNIISNSTNDYQRLINYSNKKEREKNQNENYVENLSNEKQTTVYRINNFPTYVDDINFSNPIIYPKEYDMYQDYLQEKNIKQINTQVIKKKHYLNIDSENRNIETNINVKEYINILDYSIEFTNQSNYFKIYVENAESKFKENTYIILRGLKNYIIFYEKLNFFFTNNSPIVTFDLKPNFTDIIPYYDIFIKISGVKSNNKNNWKNIPLNLINQEHKISLNEINGELRMGFILPINFYTENETDKTLISDCTITYYSIGNYPINLINSNTPITTNYLNPYLTINEIGSDYILIYLNNAISINNNISLDGIWINNNFRTGVNIQLGTISGFIEGFPNSNNFVINLDKSYSNICAIKMISSEIPNVIQNVNDSLENSLVQNGNLKHIQNINNKFYWENILDEGIYSIELEPGFYLFNKLKDTIESKISQIKRNFIYPNSYLYDYNLATIDFNTENNITKINFFNIYQYPDCFELMEYEEFNNQNICIIKIFHQNHNLKKGDMIFITDSQDYYFISKKYINTLLGHQIINVINNNYYQIKITNINKIKNTGNTKGGKSIKIKYYANFRLFFDFPDTIGSLIGFTLVGYKNSITSYSGFFQNYTITNMEPYYNDVKKIITVNNSSKISDINLTYNKTNFRYILLLAENLNNNYNPGGISYFYKFLLNGLPNSYLYNTFVQTPVYFNPPIKILNNLNFTFILPNGSLVDFGNLNLSFTLEITTIDNLPENTNISTNLARI